MRRSCERPGCSEPVAVIYGYGSEGDVMHVWLDAWSAQRVDDIPPDGARGVVCERHGQCLTAPRGWDLLDRRDEIPRLFLPRPVLVHSRKGDESGSLDRQPDTSAEVRRQRIANLPAPQLFSELRAPETTDAVSRGIVAEDASSGHETVRDGFEPSPSPSPAVGQDDGDDLDDSLSKLLDATGPLLRRAFSKRNTGRHDASKELMRPTAPQIVDESA